MTNICIQYIRIQCLYSTKPKKTLYDSCKDVSNPTTGAKALDLICGNWESGCNATNWIKFLTDKNINSMVPFQINALTSLGTILICYVITYDVSHMIHAGESVKIFLKSR